MNCPHEPFFGPRKAEAGDPVVITRHGKPVVALVPAAELEQLERLRAAGPEGGLASLAGGWEDQRSSGKSWRAYSTDLMWRFSSTPTRSRKSRTRSPPVLAKADTSLYRRILLDCALQVAVSDHQ